MTDLNKGLMIGKFCPLTNGHLTAFSLALMHCHELTVVVCIDHLHDPTDCPMNAEERIAVVKAECARISDRIKVESIDCTSFPYAKEDDLEVSKYWANVLQKQFPETTTLFGSEEYVKMMADNWPDCMGVSYQILDKDRKTTHISATMVRQNPYQYWDYIPHLVRAAFTRNVLVIGAESCGKTTLTRTLGRIFHCPVVPEMYRSIYKGKGMDFTQEDLVTVGSAQYAAQWEASRSIFNRGLVVHDTCVEITKMYLTEYYKADQKIIDLLDSLIADEPKFGLILFCDTDVQWVNDGTRTLGNEEARKRMRDKAYSLAVQKAKRHGCELVVVPADYQRLPAAIEAIEGVL